LWLSFKRSLTTLSVACSTNTAIPLSSPATVPTKTKGGSCSFSTGFGGSTGLAMTGAVGGGGGRRETEKIGRSRVIDNLESGTAKTAFLTGAAVLDAFG